VGYVLELVKQGASLLDNVLAEYVLLSVDPHKRKSLLRGVKDVDLVNSGRFQHLLVSLSKLLSVMSRRDTNS